MSHLGAFQTAFATALHDETSTFGPSTQAAFAVYRNTAMRACLDALEANFPAVVCLVGRDWFRAAAAIHVTRSPPRDARLGNYGDGFADFLAGFEPAADLPYLADVARLDRLWVESFDAADATAPSIDKLAALPTDALSMVRLWVHPATRWHVSPLPARTIWQASRAGVPVDEDLAWVPECTLLVRVAHEVHVLPSEPACIDLLAAIAGGTTLGDAAAAVARRHPGAAIDLLLSGLLRSGALTTP